jgi:hypothetical protein
MNWIEALIAITLLIVVMFIGKYLKTTIYKDRSKEFED